MPHLAVKVKQINLYNKNETIFDSLNDVSYHLGISSSSVRYAVQKKHVLAGCLWEYV